MATVPYTDECGTREYSRWLPDGATEYRVAAEFGVREGEDLVDIWGVTSTPEGDLLIFDAGSTRILKLGSDLTARGSFGREGRGPGEFQYQQVVPGRWITSSDSSFFVLSFRGFSEFDLSGEYRAHVSNTTNFFLDIPAIAASSIGLLYSVDRLDTDTGERVLETWHLDDTGTWALIRGDPMPTLPRHQGKPVRGAFVDQAEPLWAAHGRCAFISDGAGDWIVRASLTSGAVDTIHLPFVEIPARTVADERNMERMRRMGATMGIRTGSASVKPTARHKWASMIVDPDGFLWLEPWRPKSMRNDPIPVLVVNPATGDVRATTLPAFPSAFLDQASFASLRIHEQHRTPVVKRFARAP